MSGLVKLKIKGNVITSQYGTLSSGDFLTCSREYAKHLIEECHAPVEVVISDQKAAAESKNPAKKTLLEKAKNLIKK